MIKPLFSAGLWTEQPSNGFGFMLFAVAKMGNQFQVIILNFLIGFSWERK